MTTTNHFHLAQINFARMLAPLEDPIMADFVALRDEINRLGDAAPGFVWRSQSSESNEMAIRIFDDTYLLVQLSVWESVEALYTFAYRSQHATVMSRRREWFERIGTPFLALWWIPAGTIPTPEEGKARLEYLTERGPSLYAFSFKERYPAPAVLPERP